MHSAPESKSDTAAASLCSVHADDPDPYPECFATVVKHFVMMTCRSTHFLLEPVAVATVGEGSA